MYSSKSSGMPKKKKYLKCNYSHFAPTFVDTHHFLGVKFNGHCLINKIPGSVQVDLYISYALNLW